MLVMTHKSVKSLRDPVELGIRQASVEGERQGVLIGVRRARVEALIAVGAEQR